MPDLRKKIGLGTVQFGMKYGISNQTGQTPEHEVQKILDVFRSNGGSILDTASAYGESEEILGKAGVSEFRVVSKFMPPEDFGMSITAQLDQSLKKLKIDCLYGYLAHRADSIIEHPALWEELQRLKSRGTIQKAGVSLATVNQWNQLTELGIFPDLIQVPFNYFDRRFEPVMKQCKEAGGEVHTRSAFLQGLFFRDPESLPPFFSEVKPLLADIRKSQKNVNGKLLSFVLSQPFMDAAITGVETAEQLKQNYHNISEQAGLPDFQQKISEKILNPANWPLT